MSTPGVLVRGRRGASSAHRLPATHSAAGHCALAAGDPLFFCLVFYPKRFYDAMLEPAFPGVIDGYGFLTWLNTDMSKPIPPAAEW